MSEFRYERVKDPTYFEENRLAAHADFTAYADWEEYQSGESSFRYGMNGLWKFAYAPNYASALAGFEQPSFDCHGWADIKVPAHIQMEGADIPQYANVQYPWDGREQIKPGEIPEHFNPVAHYVKYFKVPREMQGKPVYISFQGVESALVLWCNGQFVGYSEDSFTPSEFELTPYLTQGENKLAALVFKWSSSSWCEDQDFFRFSGIFRDVYLYTVPAVAVRDVKVQTLLQEDYKEAKLVLDLALSGEATIVGKLLDSPRPSAALPIDTAVRMASLQGACVGELRTRTGGDCHLELSVENPKLWSAEDPKLYSLLLEIYNDAGELQEVLVQRVGFRRFELRDKVMCLNGKRIVFKGVNRHEFSSVSGRVPRREELWQDLVTMKQHNINAIRTSHYPNASPLYALCDELGLYMIAECNLESHGSWEPATRGVYDKSEVVPGDQPQWNAMMLDRANSMYQRDKNHPAILIWSCGNEAFGGKNIYDMSRFFKAQDPGRLVQYEGIIHDRRYPGTSDVESQMYTHAEDIEKWLQKDRSKPFICCEYSHAMGNSCGAMHKYTDLTDREPLYQGGFIWDYVDQSIYKKDRYGRFFQAYGGDFGDRPCDYNFSGNGIVYGGDRTPSPKMQEVKFNYSNIAVSITREKFTVKNKNLFVNTDNFTCVILLEREGKLVQTIQQSVSVEPLDTRDFPMPFEIPDTAEYAVTVSFRLKEDRAWAKAGHEVAFGQQVFAGNVASVSMKQTRPMQIIRGNYNFGVRGEEFEVLFGGKGLVSYRYGGREMFQSVPMPNFWRAPIDNDFGNHMMQRYGQWKLASMYATVENCTGIAYREGDACAVIAYKLALPTSPKTECELSYEIYGDGTIGVKLSYDPVPGLGDMPEFGVMMKMDADYDHLEWYGNGPEETYADRKHGAKLGIYSNLVADNMARYLVPQECGLKTDVRYAKVTDLAGRGILFAADNMSFSALPYTPHEMENAMHDYELPPVHYTVIRAMEAQMGVGGDDSWYSRVHDEYLIDVSSRKEFTFFFKGIV